MVHQIDHGQIGGDTRPGERFAQAVIDLVLQKFSGRIKQVKGDQTVRQAADHAVTIRADRREMLVLIEQRHRLDRIHPVRLTVEEEATEGRVHVVKDPATGLIVLEAGLATRHDFQTQAELASSDIKLTQGSDRVGFDTVAAPAEAQVFQIVDGLFAGNLFGCKTRPGQFIDRTRFHRRIARLRQRFKLFDRAIQIAPRFIQSRCDISGIQSALLVRLARLDGIKMLFRSRVVSELQRRSGQGRLITCLPDRRIEIGCICASAEAAAGIFPAFLLHRDHTAPHIGGRIRGKTGIGKIGFCIIETVQHVAGDAAHGANVMIRTQLRLFTDRQIQHADCFRREIIGQQETRQRDMPVRTVFHRGTAQAVGPLICEIALTAPAVEIHQRGRSNIGQDRAVTL